MHVCTQAHMHEERSLSDEIPLPENEVNQNWDINYKHTEDLYKFKSDFTNYKVGQVITIHGLKGAYTITLDSDAATSETFNKLGGNDYDGSTFNALMVECIDDSANAIFNYSILTYTADTTP